MRFVGFPMKIDAWHSNPGPATIFGRKHYRLTAEKLVSTKKNRSRSFQFYLVLITRSFGLCCLHRRIAQFNLVSCISENRVIRTV